MPEATGQLPLFSASKPAALPERPPQRSQVISYPIFDRWTAHPGRALTVAKIVAAFRSAEDGYPEDQCDMFDDRIEVDAHLRSLLDARVEAVARKQWILQAGGDADEDKRAALLLEAALRLVPNWIETLEHQLRANWYGYSCSEIYWERVDGLAVPVWFENAAHRRFVFDDRDRPRLLQPNNWDGAQLRAGKWWTTTRTGRITAASGLMRTAIWWSHFKMMGFRDWLIFANRFGLPYVYGTYEEPVDDTEKEILKTAVKSLGTDGWAIFSNAVEITIKEVQKTGGSEEVHGSLLRTCNSELSKLIAGATLITENLGPGSYAATREHGTRGFELILGDAERLAHSFETQVGRPFVAFNGLNARPPRLKFHLVRDTSPENRAKVFDIAVNDIGVDLDEDQVRQELQLKAPSGGALTGTRRGQASPPESQDDNTKEDEDAG